MLSCYCTQKLLVTNDDTRNEMQLKLAQLTLSYVAALTCYDIEV